MGLRYKMIALVVLLGALWGIHSIDKHYAIKAVNQEWELKSKKERARVVLTESILKEDNRVATGKKDAQIKDLDVKLSAALVSLQHRPTRPKVVTVTEVRESCTGRELFREDGEFLTREASLADKVVVERDYYYNEYENARRKLEALSHGQDHTL